MLRDLRKRTAELEPLYGKNAGLYGYSNLLKLTGIRSKTTLRVAIEGLLIKEDIEITSRTKVGTVYRIREPKEILDARARTEVRIDPATKWIYSKDGNLIDWAEQLKRITGESRSLSLVSSAEASMKNLSGIPSDIPDGIPSDIPSDIPGGVSEGVSEGIPGGVSESDTRVYQNLIHSLNSINIAAAQGEENISSNRKNDDDGDPIHRATVTAMYQKYTGNTWKPTDNDGYKAVRHLLLETIEAGIISSVLRCPTRVNSFAYCFGAILEFAEFLPPGYLFYLRRKFNQKQPAIKPP